MPMRLQCPGFHQLRQLCHSLSDEALPDESETYEESEDPDDKNKKGKSNKNKNKNKRVPKEYPLPKNFNEVLWHKNRARKLRPLKLLDIPDNSREIMDWLEDTFDRIVLASGIQGEEVMKWIRDVKTLHIIELGGDGGKMYWELERDIRVAVIEAAA